MLKRISLMLVLCAGVGLAQDAVLNSPDRPSAVTELDGRVASVDLTHHSFKVKDVHDRITIIFVGPNTTISNPSSSKLVLKDIPMNAKVHVYYTTADHKARQIDVTPAAPIVHDLETH